MGKLRTLLLASTMAVAVNTPALSQTLEFGGDVLTFGDSLSDAGNVFVLTGSDGTVPGDLFGKDNNRFVNPGGLTWIEQLLGGVPNTDGTNAASPQSVFFATGTVTGDVNLAVGGALAGSGNLNNVSNGGTPFGALPGVTEQIAAFNEAGGMISAEDTVTYWAGPNNFFLGLPGATTTAAVIELASNVAGLSLADITDLATGATIAGGGAGTHRLCQSTRSWASALDCGRRSGCDCGWQPCYRHLQRCLNGRGGRPFRGQSQYRFHLN